MSKLKSRGVRGVRRATKNRATVVVGEVGKRMLADIMSGRVRLRQPCARCGGKSNGKNIGVWHVGADDPAAPLNGNTRFVPYTLCSSCQKISMTLDGQDQVDFTSEIETRLRESLLGKSN